ncbi:MAG: ATP-binding domain-containing protein [Gemmatimonadetes bacterium]|nr:ATP-binding domain-containing protein [Gemmatimonadota bacterium]
MRALTVSSPCRPGSRASAGRRSGKTSPPWTSGTASGTRACGNLYAITSTRRSGSEWDHVLIAQDGNRDRKWLYTAITRAKERMMLCLGTD